MRVLVTGGAGFIGSHLVDRFLLEGFQVRVLDSLDPRVHPFGRPAYLPQKIEFLHGSVNDRVLLLEALKDVDIISHQAAYQDYMPDFSRFLEVNAVGTALIYELIVQHRLPVKRVVVASSQSVYGEGQYDCPEHGFFQPRPRALRQLSQGEWDLQCPKCGISALPRHLSEEYTNPCNQYAVSKLAEEKIALGLGWLHGIPTVALRYSITQGPRQSPHNTYSGICRIFTQRLLNGQPPVIYEDGHQLRDYIHIDDVVAANLHVVFDERATFESFNVGSGRGTTVLEYAKALAETLESSTHSLIPGKFRVGDNRHSVSSVAKLQALGWRPKHDLKKIMSDYLEWLRGSGKAGQFYLDADREMEKMGVVCATS
jgi:dTDP-L-rhamnose 4-epimerase